MRVSIKIVHSKKKKKKEIIHTETKNKTLEKKEHPRAVGNTKIVKDNRDNGEEIFEGIIV